MCQKFRFLDLEFILIVEQADQVTAFRILGMHSNPERIVLDHTAGDVVLHVVVLALLEVKLGEHGAAVEDMNMQNVGNVLVINFFIRYLRF